jgi:hypothetical protein
MAAEAHLSGGGKLSVLLLLLLLLLLFVHCSTFRPNRERLKPFPAFPQLFPFSAIFWSNLTGLLVFENELGNVYSRDLRLVANRLFHDRIRQETSSVPATDRHSR